MVVLAVALAALLVIAGLFAVRRIDEAHRTGEMLPAVAPKITPDPNLVVYWLGQQLDPPGTLPPLTYLLRGDASTDRYFNVTLQYAHGAMDEHADVTTILLEEMPWRAGMHTWSSAGRRAASGSHIGTILVGSHTN